MHKMLYMLYNCYITYITVICPSLVWSYNGPIKIGPRTGPRIGPWFNGPNRTI